MEEEIVLYGSGTLRTLRVHWILNELSIPYRSVNFSPRSEYANSEEYTRINLTSKIPTITIGESLLSESAAICLHISDKYGKKNFSKSIGSISRAHIYQWCFFAMSELDAHTLYILAKHGGRLKELYGESEIAVNAAKEGFESQILKLEKELEDGRAYIVDDAFSVADIFLGTCIESALNLGLPSPLQVPINCRRYWSDLKMRDTFKRAFELNNIKSS